MKGLSELRGGAPATFAKRDDIRNAGFQGAKDCMKTFLQPLFLHIGIDPKEPW